MYYGRSCNRHACNMTDENKVTKMHFYARLRLEAKGFLARGKGDSEALRL